MDSRRQYSDSLELLNNSGHGPSPAETPAYQDSTAYFHHQQSYDPEPAAQTFPPSPLNEPTAPHQQQDHSHNGLGYVEGGYDPSQNSSQPNMPKDQSEFEKSQVPRRKDKLVKSWGWEIASAVFSILCVVAMAIILSRINGQLLSSWTIALSPNTVISVLSTASKATMILPVAEGISQLKWLHLERRSLSLENLQVFDNASRGPSGALFFFWKARKGASFVAYVGCLITIAAIALDPFTQQILSYEQIPTQVQGVLPNVTRSQAYDNQGKGLNGVANVMSSMRDPLLQQAAISGLYDLVPAAPFACPGSNCTYPTFTSLGISSTCNDVTSQVIQNCIETNVSVYAQVCNYTLPSNYQIGAYAGIDAHNGFFHTTINTTVNNSMDSDWNSNDTTTPLVHLGMISFTKDDLEENMNLDSTWQKTVKAYECRYDLSAYTYSNWTSTNGTLNPGEMALSSLNLTGPGPILPLNVTDEKFPGNKSFEVNYYDMNFMAETLSNIFGYSDTYANAQYLDALFNSPDLTKTVDNIAKGMSYRMLSGPNATTVQGEVFAMQTYIRVHWAWLSLSGVLLVVACVFFGAVVAETETTRQRAWKSSLAPLLYLDVGSGEGFDEDVMSPEGYEVIRKKTIVEQLR